jgi:hypothetical protein
MHCVVPCIMQGACEHLATVGKPRYVGACAALCTAAEADVTRARVIAYDKNFLYI